MESCLFVGASDVIRTRDLLITSEMLYQLSHTSLYTYCPTRTSDALRLAKSRATPGCSRAHPLRRVYQLSHTSVLFDYTLFSFPRQVQRQALSVADYKTYTTIFSR